LHAKKRKFKSNYRFKKKCTILSESSRPCESTRPRLSPSVSERVVENEKVQFQEDFDHEKFFYYGFY